MEKVPDIIVTNINNDMIIDENQEQVKYLLTKKVDEVTGSQMKKVEVQKMEDDLTIKMLEREYLETKRNLIYSKKKLEEARKKTSTQTEMINQLLQANKAIIEKFNELKRYQNEIILINVNNAEKTSTKCTNKNNELSSVLQHIVEQENFSNKLSTNIADKKNELNYEVEKQIERKNKMFENLIEVSRELKKKSNILKTQLNQESVNSNFRDLIEEKSKRVFQLDENYEVLLTQLKQEIKNFMEEKNNKLQDINNNKKSLEEKNILISKLQSEMISLEKNQIELTETLQKKRVQKEDVLKQIIKRRHKNEILKKSFDESIKNISDDQKSIDSQLQITTNNFVKNEEDMHTELNDLYAKLEEQKKLLNILEKNEQDYSKLREIKVRKRKELSNDTELQDRYKKSSEELKKYEQILVSTSKKHNEYENKMEELYNKKKGLKQKLQLINEKCINQNLNNLDVVNINNYETSVKSVQSASPNIKSIYAFDSDDTDEDEFHIKNITPKKTAELENLEKKMQNIDPNIHGINKSDSQNEKLCDILSQKLSESSKNSRDMSVFKVPRAYATPVKKKFTQVKKY